MIVFPLLIIALLVCGQSLAFWSYRTGRVSFSRWALVACALIMVVAVVLQLGEQFVPATYERQRIRQSAYCAHLLLTAIECAICLVLPLSRENSVFWIGWWASLTVIAASVVAFVFLMTGPAI